MNISTGLIILAGGKSSRMGTNKALLPFGTLTSLQLILNELGALSTHQILVTNDPEHYESYGIELVKDNYLGLGPLAGIEAGLLASKTDWNLVVACDMPFASLELANQLLENSMEPYDAVVPRIDGKIHPLFAIYHRRILPHIQSCLQSRSLRMISLLDTIHTRFLDKQEMVGIEKVEQALFNMNHPYEYEEAKEKRQQSR